MDYSVKSIYNLLTIIIIFVPFLVFSQDIGTDYWYISSPELRYNLTEKVEVRLRPYDGFLLSNTEKETNKWGRKVCSMISSQKLLLKTTTHLLTWKK